ncbi:MAG TPA: hypothetical protein VGS41_06025, partial [Chthonomonadales bacterium]|nr:hypothetical protein [Chthonomonadales bacterium]
MCGLCLVGLTLLAAAPAAAAASPGPPYVTDDPEPVDLHHWEVYLAAIYANAQTPVGASGTAPHS